jgi:uncharacterized protein
MTQIDQRILDFIEEHHVLTLAVAKNGIPWCATCFYVYLQSENWFIFTSDEDTRHIKDVTESKNYYVAGAVALETMMVGKLRGIQFSGMMFRPDGDDLKKARHRYVGKFPIARLTKLDLWALKPDHIKMTDNRLGFGKKLIWEYNDRTE